MQGAGSDSVTITGNASVGVELYDHARADISGNVIANAQPNGEGDYGYGIEVEEGSTVGIEDNARNGITLFDGAQAEIRENVVSANGTSGMIFWDTSGGTACENECSGNGLLGIEVREQAQPTLDGNACTSNGGSGIGYWENSGGTARSNESSRNSYDGIAVADEATSPPERNTCSRNMYNGVAVFDCASPTLEENVGSYNDEAGISHYEDAGARRGTIRALETIGGSTWRDAGIRIYSATGATTAPSRTFGTSETDALTTALRKEHAFENRDRVTGEPHAVACDADADHAATGRCLVAGHFVLAQPLTPIRRERAVR
jgi:parallel beta-helix repeat protein